MWSLAIREVDMEVSVRRALAFVLFCLGVAQAQPYINYRGILNAASFTPQGPSGSEIAQGSIFSIFGTGLGPATLVQVNQFPLQTSLANVSVKVVQGTASVNALPIVVTAGQLNVIMPSNAPVGRVSITVTFNGATSNPVTATVAASSFGIFSAASTGYGPGIVQNFVSATSQPINSLAATAAPGQPVTLWGTGLGPVAADNVAPTAGNLATPVEVFVGGQQATLLYNGRSPCCSGVDQIVFNVPANAPLGCYVPVQVRTNHTVLSNSVTMAIQNAGTACSDSLNPLSAAFQKGGNLGVAVLAQSENYIDVDANTPVDVTSNLGMLTLRTDPGGAFFFNPAISTPPAGSCSTYTVSGLHAAWTLPDLFGGLGAEMDAGASVNVSGNGSASIARAASSPLYVAALGTNDPVLGPSSLVINPSGTTTVSSKGGSAVGAFSVAIPAAPAFNWINRSQIFSVDRSQPLALTWGPAGLQGLMVVAGLEYDLPTNTQRSFVCSASAGAGTFSVPAYILGTLQASRPNVGQSTGILMLGTMAPPVPFSASGLNSGFGLGAVSSGKSVLFQ
jgi:uncharacterized protein (TIGR03437 family)